MNWSINESGASSRPDATACQLGARQSAGVCHPSRTFVSFRLGLPGFPACFAIPVRRPPVPLARLSCGRSPALVRLRPVLCVARRLSDVTILFSIPSRSVVLVRSIADALGQLPPLPADHGRSQPHWLLALQARPYEEAGEKKE